MQHFRAGLKKKSGERNLTKNASLLASTEAQRAHGADTKPRSSWYSLKKSVLLFKRPTSAWTMLSSPSKTVKRRLKSRTEQIFLFPSALQCSLLMAPTAERMQETTIGKGNCDHQCMVDCAARPRVGTLRTIFRSTHDERRHKSISSTMTRPTSCTIITG